MNKKTRNSILLIVVILVLAGGGLIFQKMFLEEHGTYAVVASNGKEITRLNLAENKKINVESAAGGYNIIEVKDNKVSVIESNCDNQICVNQGTISQSHEMIVCLPHGLAITIESN